MTEDSEKNFALEKRIAEAAEILKRVKSVDDWTRGCNDAVNVSFTDEIMHDAFCWLEGLGRYQDAFYELYVDEDGDGESFSAKTVEAFEKQIAELQARWDNVPWNLIYRALNNNKVGSEVAAWIKNNVWGDEIDQ